MSQCELAAAYEVSRRTIPVYDASARIRVLRGQGKFVVVTEQLKYCRYTDGILGLSFEIESIHSTEAEARTACPRDEHDESGEHARYMVGPQQPEIKLPFITDQDIPF